MSLRFPGIDSPKLARLPAFAALLGLAMCSGVCDQVASAAEPSQLKTSTDASAKPTPVYFGTDVVPTLTRLGCNTGGCHGKASGQNGFRLSLLGFEPDVDYASLVSEARGRRLFPAAPERSLLLQKATSRLPHGGGRRLDEESDDYRLLRDWIAAGAPPPRATDPRLVRIEVTPGAGTMVPGGSQQLKVTAVLSDGTTRDVTKRSVYQSNEPSVLSVDDGGLVKTDARQGLASVMARFGDQIATFHAAVPFGGGPNDPASAQRRSLVTQQLDALQTQINANNAATPDAANNTTRSSAVSRSSTAPRAAIAAVDRLLVRQWRRMNVAPSPVVDDAKFLRRASLDICGTLPTPAEIDEYVADARPDKRERLIDRLLERPEYASYFGLKWADILQNRGAGYSTSKQRAGTTLFAQWIRDSIATNKPYDRFVAEILTASGSQAETPPALWYRSVRKSPEYVESVAQAFLGVRIQCAQCHHHPAERWSQSDYYGLAAVFARVGRKGGFADAEVPTDETIYLKPEGRVVHPRTGEVMRPTALGGEPLADDPLVDPRRTFAEWVVRADNPFFARTMANRMWAHFLGRGIVNPIDDSRSTNPPSDPELLDTLAQSFAAGGYDVKQLIRTITNSLAYRLDSAPTDLNRGDSQTFARFYPRRLSAEVLLDALSQVLEVPTEFPAPGGKFPIGTRAIDLPDENVAAHFLDVFGRPARLTACECERVDSPALTQALELVNSTELQRKLTAPTGYAARIAAASNRATDDRVREIFLRTMGRKLRDEETEVAVDFLNSQGDQADAYRSLLWSLLVTNEFMFNH